MKRVIAMLLALACVMGLVACGNNAQGGETTTTPAAQDQVASALEILETVWGSYADDEKFFAMGGDMNNMVDNAPGAYSLEDEGLTATLLVPADQIANLDEAASLVHGMMLNNFTCGAYHVTGDVNAFAEAMYTAISTNPWICGQPEKLIVAIVGGEYVVAMFGINDAINPFEAKLTEAYPNTNFVYNEAIAG